jgi:predicted TIM-barrel fold metal-dependent hydrolase
MTNGDGGQRPDWLPEGAIDCHLHVVDPARFPYVDGPGYMPPQHETGNADQLAETLRRHGIAGALLVQPSCYGSDNSAMLSAMQAARGRYKAIAMIDPAISDAELDFLAEAGTVGVRLNAVNMGVDAVRAATPLLPKLAGRKWLVELQCPAARLPELSAPILDAGLRLILDHIAYPDPDQDISQTGFRHALQLAPTGRVFVKLSGAFRLSRQPFPHPDLDPFARAVLDTFGPERCLWGSDWPFVASRLRPSYRATLDMLARWLPDEGARSVVLTQTPRSLFGF